MLHRLSLLLLLLCSAIVAPANLEVYNMKAWGVYRTAIVKGNAYVMAYCDDRIIGNTVVKNSTDNPEWTEHFTYRRASVGSNLKLIVYDRGDEFDHLLVICETPIKTGIYLITCQLITTGMFRFNYRLPPVREV